MKLHEPYRKPCGGKWVAWTGCAEHYDASENHFRVYNNVTKVPDPNTEDVDPVSPYSRISCDIDPEAYTLEPRCGQYVTIPPLACAEDVLTVIDNCYEASDPPTYRDFSSCHKFGFKNLQAWKMWHGRFGFIYQRGTGLPCPVFDGGTETEESSSLCNYTTAQYSPPLTRFRHLDVVFTKTVWEVLSEIARKWVYTYSATVSVDIYGNITASGNILSTTQTNYDPDGSTSDSPIEPTEGAPSPDLDFVNATCVSPSSTTDEVGTTTTVTASETEATTTVQGVDTDIYIGYGGGYFTTAPIDGDGNPSTFWQTINLIDSTATATLSVPYTSDDVNADVDSLLNDHWDLSNDALYPWRTDENVTSAPLLSHDESTSQVEPLLGLTTTTDYTGTVRGSPMPIGYDAFWDFRRENLTWDADLLEWILTSYGKESPYPHATQWTHDQAAAAVWGGAWSYGGSALPDVHTGNPLPVGTLYKQKWVESILFVKPSHNFARPCGSIDRCTIDQNTINCDSNPTGDLRWPTAPCDCGDPLQTAGDPPDDCPTDGDCTTGPDMFKWNDFNVKGDYIRREFTYNFRDVGEIARLRTQYELRRDVNVGCDLENLGDEPDMVRDGDPLSNIDVTQQCAVFRPCKPVPVTLTPPHLNIDEHYTSFAYIDIHQWMVDPLWQMPLVACEERDAKENRADDGSCGASPDELAAAILSDKEIVWILPPYEEARCTLPDIDGSTAPALPDGINLGCVNTGSVDAPVWVGPECSEPVKGSMFCCWAIWLRQLTYDCFGTIDFTP